MKFYRKPKASDSNCRRTFLFVVSLTVLLITGGCAGSRNLWAYPELEGYYESGKASYYAMKYQNRKTASGERFNNYAMTAAHKILPFGTRVIVTNIKNAKAVIVTINDRGPYIKGRIIDLSQAAFAKIESLDKGIAEVNIRVVN